MKLLYFFLSLLLPVSLTLLPSVSAAAVDYEALAEERKTMPIESNSYDNWPIGPAIGAQSAILIEAGSGALLYEKNIHERLYPASITKLLTTYIAVQECEMDEMVTFSQEAVNSINWWEDANMAVNPGASLSVQDVLYGILVGSANEAAYALAEHISGSIEEFALLMNQTARELGCTDSNFMNPNGIHHENHYTTAHDMAIIAKAFFSNELLSRISGTTRFEVPVNETQKREGIVLTAKSQLHPGKTYGYDSLVGTKTGYTDLARQTLVSCASKNGMKLICVILKEEAPAQFTDTVSLFDYGFDNFEALNIHDTDTTYSIDNYFFTTEYDLLGSSKPIFSLSAMDYIVLPNTAAPDSISSRIVYDSESTDEIASVHYYYRNAFLGRIPLKLMTASLPDLDVALKGSGMISTEVTSEGMTVYINVLYLFAALILTALLLPLLFLPFSLRKRRNLLTRLIRRSRWKIDRF